MPSRAPRAALWSLLSEVSRPKTFSGLFGAAPSIALAALVVTIVSSGTAAARTQSTAMIFGALAMVGFCIAAVVGVDRFGALRGSLVASAAWVLVAAASYAIFLAR